MRDFTLGKYRELLKALSGAGYKLISFEEYLQTCQPAYGSAVCYEQIEDKNLPTDDPAKKFVILRHDIDKRAAQAVSVAEIEQEAGAHASYYFRVVKESNRPEVIRKIADMGFEVGYHYEDMSLCKGEPEAAKAHFEEWLEYFRRYYPVRTICMHGAPQSGYDSKDLWKHCDYHDFGIIGEPYFDTDFSRVVYLTDTGRRWDGYRVSVRDKIPQYQEQWQQLGYVYHSTDDIIRAANTGTLPGQLMITTHPQRWTDKPWLWHYELLRQTFVNMLKKMIVK